MTLEEANALLDSAPHPNRLCKVNKSITVAEAVEILKRAINSPSTKLVKDGVLDPIAEYRVRQVSANRIRV